MADTNNTQTTTIADLVGISFEDQYLDFDLTPVKKVLVLLNTEKLIDLAHADFFQQRSLYAADLISDYLAKLVKMISYHEAKINTAKNKAALAYEAPGGRTTADLRKFASECAPEVEQLQNELAKLKGAKAALDKKYDILIKFHHLCKEMASKYRGGGHIVAPIIDNASSEGWG